MGKPSIGLKQFSPSSSDGFTLLELLVSSLLGLLVVALGLSTVLSNRRIYKHDIVQTKINQNLRSAIDILGMNVRQAGEALPAIFPAVEVIDGTSGAQDELIIRRNLHENEVLNVCQTITAGTANTSVLFAYSTTDAACDYATELQPYILTWNAYRTEEGGTAQAYIFNRSTKEGEFFTFTNVIDSSATSQMTIQKNATTWQHSYAGDGLSAAMYLIEEYHFRVTNSTLELIENNDTTNILNIVDGITGFQVKANMLDGTTKTSFTNTDSWTQIKSLEITLTGEDTFAGKTVTNTVSEKLYPRNILSN